MRRIMRDLAAGALVVKQPWSQPKRKYYLDSIQRPDAERLHVVVEVLRNLRHLRPRQPADPKGLHRSSIYRVEAPRR